MAPPTRHPHEPTKSATSGRWTTRCVRSSFRGGRSAYVSRHDDRPLVGSGGWRSARVNRAALERAVPSRRNTTNRLTRAVLSKCLRLGSPSANTLQGALAMPSPLWWMHVPPSSSFCLVLQQAGSADRT